MLNLSLQANISGWAVFCERRQSENFKSIRIKVFHRDQYKCQYCGFYSKRFQQVVNKDNDYTNNEFDNLVTACALCAQCGFLGCAKFGTIIYMPEYSQTQLNHVTRALFCSMQANSDCRDIARTLYRSFKNRSKNVEDLFGEGASDSMVFGQSMFDAGVTNSKKTEKVFSILRLLPYKTPLENPVQYWTSLLEEHL